MVAMTADHSSSAGLPREVADDDFCYLTSTGRVSGRPHEIEIWFALDGTRLFMLAGGRDRSDWVRNLRADPDVTIRLREVTRPYRAQVVSDPGLDRRARDLLFEKYEPRYPGLADWRESALPVMFEPVDRNQ
jgi:deazaflavin-dependent oxidoreductase (nitroreductase family)